MESRGGAWRISERIRFNHITELTLRIRTGLSKSVDPYQGLHCLTFNQQLPASVAQLDTRPTGDQKVTGSTPAKVGNILSWRLIMK